MKFLLALAFAAPLFAQTTNCYVVTPPSFNHLSAATYTSTVHVANAPGQACGNYNVNVPPQFDWLHIQGDKVSGIPGDLGVSFTVDQNQYATARSGFMTIALQTVTVFQDGAVCTFSMTPASQNFPVGGGNATLTVQANCGWQATTSANWIAVTTDNQVSPVGYSVAANTCATGRSGAISLLQTNLATPPTLAVTQDGAPNNISLSAYSATVAAPASNGRINVTTGDVCFWSATTDVSWIQITFGVSGTGNGGISYHVLDNTTAQRTGSIHVGSLTYTITQLAPAAPSASLKSVASAANYNADAVSPGEIVALFGDNLGPASIAITQAGDISNGIFPNTLAGTQVLFDGVPAPLLYTLKGQVSAVVPYGVAGKASTQVQVSYQGSVSNTMTVPVRATTPAIFSLDASGVGPGAILNQDLSINTTGNAAERLSVIALYCTGGGVTTPASADGAVIGDASFVLAQTPVVTIGGLNAAVKYAGAAPGSVAGLTQINVEVPASVTPGLALPVIVRIGDFASTGSVTVAVK
jgi:uncharacterized protein (TIGR03437 family)